MQSIGALCDTLIDAVCERGECDFVRDLAAPLPMAVIGDMLGVLPDEREMFLQWSDDMVVGSVPLSTEADMQVTMDAFVGVQRLHPQQIDAAPRRADRRPDQRPGARRGRRRPAVRRRHPAGVAADPHRRRRDDPPHDLRRHRAAAAPPRPVGAAASTIPT